MNSTPANTRGGQGEQRGEGFVESRGGLFETRINSRVTSGGLFGPNGGSGSTASSSTSSTSATPSSASIFPPGLFSSLAHVSSPRNNISNAPTALKKEAQALSSKRKKAPSLLNAKATVTLHSGDDPEPFVIHKEFICHYSDVLKAAFNSNFIEGQTQVYKLLNTSKGAIRLLVHWCYTQQFDLQQIEDSEQLKLVEHSNLKKEEDVFLVELWILAGKLLIPTLQNAVIHEIERINTRTGTITRECFQLIYENDNTVAGSPLRRFFVHLCATQLSPIGYFQSHLFPHQMLIEIVDLIAPSSAVHNPSMIPKSDMKRFEVPET